METSKLFLLTGTVVCGLGVALGAFGAHALEKILEESGRKGTYETAVHYQFYHGLGLLLLGALAMHLESGLLKWSGFCMIFGVLVFSGSLYLLCLTGIRWLGAITPIGGLAFIGAWVLAFLGVWKSLP